MKIDLSGVILCLTEKQRDRLYAAVGMLESGVAAGVIRNKDFVDAKDCINRRVEEIVNAYNESRGWGFDPIVSNAHSVPAGLKSATKLGDKGRIAMFSALLPVADLIKACKPLIVKRQDQGPTEKQVAVAAERAGHEMTCQCCGRGIFANGGKIAHHGYQRPGDGWQTASCAGATYLPFEVSRERLGHLIDHLIARKVDLIAARCAVYDEVEPVTHHYSVYDRTVRGGYRSGKVVMTRATYDAVAKLNIDNVFTHRRGETFDTFKIRDLDKRDANIRNLRHDITVCQTRYDGWKQTHEWRGDKWVALETVGA
jgi:hypothetical protein